MPQIKVIPIPVDELPRLTECAERFFAISKTPGIFNLAHFVNTWTSIISSGYGIILAAEEQNEIVGALGGLIHPDPNTGEKIASEAFWYVNQEGRGLAGIHLYRAFEQWARDRQAAHLRMTYLKASMPAKVERFYERLGFEEIERTYTKALTPRGSSIDGGQSV